MTPFGSLVVGSTRRGRPDACLHMATESLALLVVDSWKFVTWRAIRGMVEEEDRQSPHVAIHEWDCVGGEWRDLQGSEY